MLLDEPVSEHPQAPQATEPEAPPGPAAAARQVGLAGTSAAAAELVPEGGEDGGEDMLADGDSAGDAEDEYGSVSGDSSQDISMGRSSQEQDDEATLDEEEVRLLENTSLLGCGPWQSLAPFMFIQVLGIILF